MFDFIEDLVSAVVGAGENVVEAGSDLVGDGLEYIDDVIGW